MSETCPKCGAAYSHRGCTPCMHRRYTKYECNYVEYDDGTSDEARDCLCNQLAAANAEIGRLREALAGSAAALDALTSFCGQNLRVANWHQNGDLEPWDNFFDETGAHEALEAARAAVAEWTPTTAQEEAQGEQ